ncbi:cell wall hydrolase [Kineothrix alysoides]|uniref:Cell wall hydrolase n=1 Tax=Kineothrix alysoides TaxID=1469948 RepID=A0A4R1R3E7_9FIRM|nr:cell wall hydrolase [Kineothrix alysoides]TCL59943.1 cell wall hydrolase [Kineothrix alysoides]
MKTYKKNMTILLLCNVILAVTWFNVKELQINRIAATPAFQIRFMEDQACLDAATFIRMVTRASSGQRVVDYNVIERKAKYTLSKEDYEVLLKIVEAEAGCEDVTGKMLVAGVVMNRVESGKFPDTVKGVVFQRENGVAQFSPIADGRYDKVTVSEETKEAVEKVLYGEDITKGALYFASRKYADPEKMKWFDNSLTLLFSYGGHEFFS